MKSYAQGWQDAIEAAARLVSPDPHVTEERRCQDVAAAIRTLTPTSVEHPMQEIVMEDGVARFRANAIVRHLLDYGIIDLNALAGLPFSPEDRRQFAQLIGYSVSGYGELSYAEGHDSVQKADAIADAMASGKANPTVKQPSVDTLLNVADFLESVAADLRAHDKRKFRPPPVPAGGGNFVIVANFLRQLAAKT